MKDFFRKYILYITSLCFIVCSYYYIDSCYMLAHNQKVIVIGKTITHSKSILACKPINTELFNSFDYYVSYAEYLQTKNGDILTMDIPMDDCKYIDESIIHGIFLIWGVILGLVIFKLIGLFD